MSLTTQETRQIEQLLSTDGSILAMTAVRLYQSSAREYSYFLTGVIALHRSSRGNFSFKIVDLKANRAVWEFPIVGDIKYLEDRPYFHSFVGQNCMMGLSFADDEEAKLFADWYKSRENFVPPAPLVAKSETYQHNLKTSQNSIHKEPTPSTKEPSSSSSKKDSSGGGIFGFGRKNSDKTKPKFDKTMISAPSNFEHVSHVGFSATSGFSVDNIPMEWKLIFQKAGITDEQLQDKKQRKVVKQFMKDNAGLVQRPEISAPQPITGQTSPGMSRRAPPPPPSKRAPPPAPTRGSVSVRQEAPPPQQQNQAYEPIKAQKVAPNPPARRLSNAPQPTFQPSAQVPHRGPVERVVPSIPDRGPPVERTPPAIPSSRPAIVPSGGPPPPPPPMSSGPPLPPTAPRAQKQAVPQAATPKGKPTDLLSQIQQGTKLKAVQQTDDEPASTPKSGDDLADALKAALGNRLLAVAGSDSDGDSDDSEW